MMSGNWAQHSFVDPNAAKNDYKTALTCVNTIYNKNAFNDGYHTSHHLNSIRHWQDHPESFLNSIETYKIQQVMVFENIDFFGVWFMLMIKNYGFLAKRLVLKEGSIDDKILFLKQRLGRLTKEQLQVSFGSKNKSL
jgi:hypothetical protein